MTEERDGDDSDIDVFETASSGQTADSDGRWVDLPHANLLSVEDADDLLRWRSASVVAIVGERNGGKTTLVTELYERYLRGPFADYLFTHCLSSMGFELKTFESRADSGADTPDTPRTSKQDGLKFFHLALSSSSELVRTDLLISERAGEAYRDVRDHPSGAPELLEVRKAAKVVFILDGERVADPLRRTEAIASIRHLARAFSDTGAAPPSAELQLVTTKWDLLNSAQMVAARDVLAAFESQFVTAYERRYAKVSVFHVAARDPKGELEAAYGLAPLLQSWLQPHAPSEKPEGSPTPVLLDEFDKLLVRRVG